MRKSMSLIVVFAISLMGYEAIASCPRSCGINPDLGVVPVGVVIWRNGSASSSIDIQVATGDCEPEELACCVRYEVGMSGGFEDIDALRVLWQDCDGTLNDPWGLFYWNVVDEVWEGWSPPSGPRAGYLDYQRTYFVGGERFYQFTEKYPMDNWDYLSGDPIGTAAFWNPHYWLWYYFQLFVE